MIIYKYKQFTNKKEIDYIEEIFRNESFYFNKWDNLNDPMEGYFSHYISELTEDELDKIRGNKNALGICCFSLSYKNLLMWSFYSNGHKGICFEIDTKSDCSDEVSFENIDYMENIPQHKPNKDIDLIAKNVLSKKISIWSFEDEIRAFCNGNSKSLKVGRITKIIFGHHFDKNEINYVELINELVKNNNMESKIYNSKIIYRTNEININQRFK
jgi:hypothetical protein